MSYSMEARQDDQGHDKGKSTDVKLFSSFRDYGGVTQIVSGDSGIPRAQQQAKHHQVVGKDGVSKKATPKFLHLDTLETHAPTPKFVYLITFCAALGEFLCGFDMGNTAGAMILVRKKFTMSAEWQEVLVGITMGTGAIFALIGGLINQFVGRKSIIIAVGPIFAVGTTIAAAANNKTILLIGRIVVGASLGKHNLTYCHYFYSKPIKKDVYYLLVY